MKAKENGTMPDWFNNAINIKSYVGYDGKQNTQHLQEYYTL